jgi:hypothetical protein
MSGNFTFSDTVYSQIITKIPNKFDYLVQNGKAEMFARETYQNLATKNTPKQALANIPDREFIDGNRKNGLKKSPMYINYLIKDMDFSTIEFVPVEYYKNLESGAIYRNNSGCRYSNKEESKELIRYNNETTDIPYFSAIAEVIKSNISTSYIEKSNAHFLKLLKLASERIKQAEKACFVGLKALDISGTIESSRLK